MGMKNVEQLQQTFSQVKEWFDERGESYVFTKIRTKEGFLVEQKITPWQLKKYDETIKGHIDYIAKHRWFGFKLKYFQYLSILFVEHYLSRLFEDKSQFISDMNIFIEKHNKGEKEKDKWSYFTPDDMDKLALYQATGSGKTLLSHINYLQYIHHYNKNNKEPLDMILLITPKDSLSQQHKEEFEKSGIESALFQWWNGGTLFDGIKSTTIQIMEITKLKEEKTGDGKSIDIEFLEWKKLILVDEWHKGTLGKQWKKMRQTLGKDSFTIEYSATFWQAVKKDPDLVDEYGKAIIFDYSYRYFHWDGYGKDYSIINIKENIEAENQFTFMLANLLTFVEQSLFYEKNTAVIKEYNIEKPLWVFVWNSVNSPGTKEKSDVVEVIEFLAEVIENREKSISSIHSIITNNTPLVGQDGVGLFDERLGYLKKVFGEDGLGVYNYIQKSLFHSTAKGLLHLVDIKNSSGELWLKVWQNQYFWVINVGDTKGIVKMATDYDNITVEEDNFSSSLFDSINTQNSPLQLLIGSKKFSEGWNSYRVSCMGLLNMGTGEGSQIIQLFGRWVRLKGINYWLKRSEKSGVIWDKSSEDEVFMMRKTLETLYIFGVRANYMDKFKDYLQEDWINTKNYTTIQFDTMIHSKLFESNLKVPRVKKGLKYKKYLEVCYDKTVGNKQIIIDMTTKIGEVSSFTEWERKVIENKDYTPLQKWISSLFDWNYICFVLRNYIAEKKYTNLSLTKEKLLSICIHTDWYGLLWYTPSADYEILITREQDITITLMKKYITKFYNHHRQDWEKDKMEYVIINEKDNNIIKNYTLKVDETEKELIKEIEEMKKNLSELDNTKNSKFFHTYTINFDRHLYKPLFVKEPYKESSKVYENKVISSPEGLNKDEARFIDKLQDFITNDSYEEFWWWKSFYLLRNLKKAEWGVSFFEANNFSPDFILWIIEWDKQDIIFLDPKGMRQQDWWIENSKVQLHKTIKEKQKLLWDENINLHSFLLSGTSEKWLSDLWNKWKTDFLENWILFLEDTQVIRTLLEKIEK